MSITTKTVTAYYAPTARRHFLTKRAAINKEARAIIQKHFPSQKGCNCGECHEPDWHLETSEPERWGRYYGKLCRAINGRFMRAQQGGQ